MGAFRRDGTAGREIVTALAIKLAAIALLFFLFFAPAHRPDVDSGSVRNHLLGGASTTEGDFQ